MQTDSDDATHTDERANLAASAWREALFDAEGVPKKDRTLLHAQAVNFYDDDGQDVEGYVTHVRSKLNGAAPSAKPVKAEPGSKAWREALYDKHDVPPHVRQYTESMFEQHYANDLKGFVKAVRDSSTEAHNARVEKAKRAKEADDELAVAVRDMNKRFGLMITGTPGPLSVWSTAPDERGKFQIFGLEAFRTAFAKEKVSVPTANGMAKKPLGTLWLSHDERRDFNGVGFWPLGKAPSGALNLWTGFAVEPKAGDWSTIKRHLLEVLCRNDEGAYEFLRKWMAWKIQNPTLHPEVAVALFSEVQGTGKGAFARIFANLFGNAHRHVGDSSHVLGAFSDILVGAVSVFLDEAVFSDNPKETSKMLGIITEPRITFAQKYLAAESIANCLAFIIATNRRKAVDVARTDRRHLVLDVDPKYAQQESYFRPLFEAIDGPELQAMLFDLLAEPLGDWHPRFNLYHTKAAHEQKRRSLKGVAAWWNECLDQGAIVNGADGYAQAFVDGNGERYSWDVPADDGAWEGGRPIQVDRGEAHRAYAEWHRRQHSRDATLGFGLFYNDLKGIWPAKVVDRGSKVRGPARKRLQLPGLPECRKHFEEWLSGSRRAHGVKGPERFEGGQEGDEDSLAA